MGEVTDDTSQMYEMALAVIKSKGNFTVNDAANALIDGRKNIRSIIQEMQDQQQGI